MFDRILQVNKDISSKGDYLMTYRPCPSWNLFWLNYSISLVAMFKRVDAPLFIFRK